MRSLIILTILITGCTSSSMINSASENDKDVLILSILIQDHLRKTNGQEFNSTELLLTDSLNRISQSFEKIELKSKGGHISVYYKFSTLRDPNGVNLDNKEIERTKYFKWAEGNLKNKYDGEIRFEFGERFYRLRRIINNKTS